MVKVALVGCTGVLGEIISRAVVAESDLAVVAELAELDCDAGWSDLDVDIVLWNNADEIRIAEWLTRLSDACGPRVLATLADGRHGALWELTPNRIELGDISRQRLIDTIRDRLRSAQ